MAYYIIAGPAGAGNIFGYYRAELVRDGEYIIAEHGEYANGGRGPSTVDGKRYRSREAAELALRNHAEQLIMKKFHVFYESREFACERGDHLLGTVAASSEHEAKVVADRTVQRAPNAAVLVLECPGDQCLYCPIRNSFS